MNFYTYTWLRKDGSPYYVGKGKGDRAFYSCPGHRPPKDRSRIKINVWPEEDTAFAYEIYQIDFWGRKDIGTGILRNMSDGGLGGALTGEALEKMKASRKGYRPSAETKAKTSATMKGTPKSPSHVAKMVVGACSLGGKIAGRLAAENGQLARYCTLEVRSKGGVVAGTKNTHQRWHINRGVVNPQCLLCTPSLGGSI